MADDTLVFRDLGLADYQQVWTAMQNYTDTRGAESDDEVWFLEHPPVYTQGQAGKAEHILNAGQIPVVQVDRGGQVTYHGPGQLVGYLLIDLKRRGIGVRLLVTAIEEAIVDLLADYGIEAAPRADAPGVYVDGGAKIAQLGLRVRRGCSFHGLSLNISMDLAPFLGINPCGHVGMDVTRMIDCGVEEADCYSIARELAEKLRQRLDYSESRWLEGHSLPTFEQT